MAVLKPPCEALSERLFIVLHGQTQRMVLFFLRLYKVLCKYLKQVMACFV